MFRTVSGQDKVCCRIKVGFGFRLGYARVRVRGIARVEDRVSVTVRNMAKVRVHVRDSFRVTFSVKGWVRMEDTVRVSVRVSRLT